MKNKIIAGGFTSFVAAVQPPTGGRAPGKEPIMVFHFDFVLDGV